jgi:hypothetical protein
MNEERFARILSLEIRHRRFGFAVLERVPRRLLDTGVRTYTTAGTFKERIEPLLSVFSPSVSTWTDQMNTIRATTNPIGATMRNGFSMNRIAPLSSGGIPFLPGSSGMILAAVARKRFTSPVQESSLGVGSQVAHFAAFMEGRAGLWQTFFYSARMPTSWQPTS